MRQEIAHSRARLVRDLEGLRYELDVPLKLRKSFQRNAGLWVSAAVLAGVAFTARSLPKKKVVYTVESKSGRKVAEEHKRGLLSAGLAIGALRFAAVLVRPMVMSFVRQKLGGYISGAGRRSKW